MSGGPPVVVVEPDVIARSAIAAAFDDAVELDGVRALREEVNGGGAVVLFGPSMSKPEGLAEVGPLLSSTTSIGAILVAEQLSTELLQSALRAGFRDVLAQPVDDKQLVDSVQRVSATLPAYQPPAPPADSGGAPGLARTITVFSTKGGAGKSVLATNVAVALAKRQEGPVILVDADLQFGDVSVMLKLAPRHTIVDAVNALDRLDASYLEELLVEHPESGVKVLAAPLEPAFADQIGATEMLKLLDLLRQMSAYVVIDTPAYFNDVVLALIEESDDVLLLAGMDIPNIKNVRIGLQTLRLLNTPMSKIKLILNRSNSKVKLDISEVERTLQVEAVCRIPSDVAVPQSVNKGVPIVTDAPKSGPAKAIDGLVKQLVKEAAR